MLKLKLPFVMSFLLALTACGGGGGGGGSSTPVANSDPQGFWGGTSSA